MSAHFKMTASALALALSAASAQAITINGNALLPIPAVLGNGTGIESAAPGFGSAGPVTLNYAVSGFPELRYWNSDYSGNSAAYCGTSIATSANCALELTVASGNTVTLKDFSLGGYLNANRDVTWSVVDLFNSSIIASATDAFVSGSTGLLNTINATSSVGFHIFFGPDGYNGGITSVNYSFNNPTPIPLPAAGLLMLAGLGGLAALRRRKQA